MVGNKIKSAAIIAAAQLVALVNLVAGPSAVVPATHIILLRSIVSINIIGLLVTWVSL